MFLTAGVTKFGEANKYDVDLCAEDEPLSGIIVGQADDATDLDKDSDSTFADNVNLKMAVPIPGEEVYLTSANAASVTYGKMIQCEAGFFGDSDFAASISNANVPTAWSQNYQSLEAVTGVSGLEYIFLAKRV